MRRPALPRWHS